MWGVDNVVELIQICSYFMVSERFLSEIFRCTFPTGYCLSFRENQFLEVLFTLKLSGSAICLSHETLCFVHRTNMKKFLFLKI